MILPAVLAIVLAAQDDVTRLLEQLHSDEFSEREAAQRSLERMGPPVVDRLKAELAKTSELDTQIRLKTLIAKIPKLAQLALVYGPTKRTTLSANNEPLDGILKQLESGLGEQILRGKGLDLKAAVTVELQEATLWEAFDRVARASKTHYDYRKEGVWWHPGEAPDLPTVYYEQFRISLGEVKRMEYRSPGEKGAMAVIVPEVKYQRNLTPSGNKYRHVFEIDSIANAAGVDPRDVKRPLWTYDSFATRIEFAMEEFYLVDPAAGPFTVSGRATINFAQEYREILLPIAGEPKEIRTADANFRMAGTKPDGVRTMVVLDVDVTEPNGQKDRMKGGWLIDPEGKRHNGIILGLHQDGKHFRPEISFPGEIKEGSSILFRWMTGLHAVEVPFTLRDIKIP